MNEETIDQTGHNKPELTEDERRALLYHHKRAYEQAEAALTAAKTERKSVCDLAKAECGKGAVADIKELIALEHPAAGAALRLDIERRLRLARWANAQVGTQFTFADMDVPPSAYELGKTAGLNAQVKRPPFDPGDQRYESWCNGWNDGQAVNIEEIRDKIKPMPASAPIVPDMSDPPFAAPAQQ
jgi:hypothetical protein